MLQRCLSTSAASRILKQSSSSKSSYRVLLHSKSQHQHRYFISSSWNTRPLLSTSIIPDKKEEQQHKKSSQKFPLYNRNSATNPQQYHQIRQFHSTQKREILPLVALVIGGITIRYSFKALQRMNEEWEEYEEALREYKLEQGLDPDAPLDEEHQGTSGSEGSLRRDGATTTTTFFKGGKMAIDLGTVNIRIAHSKSDGKEKKPHVVVDRQGGRSTPNSILLSSSDEDEVILGRLAHAKLHETGSVLNPHDLLQSGDDEEEKINKAVRSVIHSAAKNALEQTLGSAGGGSSTKPLFNIDASSMPGSYETQPIYTYPPPSSSSPEDSDAYLARYEKAAESLSSPSSISNFIPEPIAAVRGAKLFDLIPSETKEPILVIDVGGTTTSVSLINTPQEEIQHSTSIPFFGGQTLVDALVTNLIQSFYSLPTSDELNDNMAKQRLYDASSHAVVELSTKSRVDIDIPYLTVDEKMQPKHLKMGVSRMVLEAEMNELVKKLMEREGKGSGDILSASFPAPTSISTLLSSVLMKVFESSHVNPFQIGGVLVVGGGARSPIVIDAVKKGVGALAGDQFVQEKLVVPEGELVEELVVIGAAASSFDK